MFDTHCHLQFKSFPTSPSATLEVNNVIKRAKEAGVDYIVVPGTDIHSSEKAIEIAEMFDGVYAAVGIHPHHTYEELTQNSNVKIQNHNLKLKAIEELLQRKKVVAIGEVGIDRYRYKQTKYEDYKINEDFIGLQKELFRAQIGLAIKYGKSLILHNREAKEDFLSVLKETWDNKLSGRTVFHCCEPDEELLEYAKEKNIFIGVDGDVTYDAKKQEFVKKIPLEMLILETDSPFLTPEPVRSSAKKRPLNEPANIKIIAEFITTLRNDSINRLIETTTENAKKLFNLPED